LLVGSRPNIPLRTKPPSLSVHVVHEWLILPLIASSSQVQDCGQDPVWPSLRSLPSPPSFCLVQGGYGSNLCLSPGVLGEVMLKDVFSLPEVLTWQNISLEVVRATSSLLGSGYLRMKPKLGEEHQNMEGRGLVVIVFEYLDLAVLPIVK